MEQEIENLAKLIESLEDTDKEQLFILMSKRFKDRLPDELKKTITMALPSSNTSLLYAFDTNLDIVSNLSNEDYYEQQAEGEIPENSNKNILFLFY